VTIFFTALHVMACFVLIVVVLLQRGKGADMGAVFGSGASSTVFGSRGAGNFLTKLTTGSAIIFMLTSLVLSSFGSSRQSGGLFDSDANEPAPAAEASPFATPEQDGAGATAPPQSGALSAPGEAAAPEEAKPADAAPGVKP
jgi:preprotein translocase subunit SecG